MFMPENTTHWLKCSTDNSECCRTHSIHILPLLLLKRAHHLMAGPRLQLALGRAVHDCKARAPLQLTYLHSTHHAHASLRNSITVTQPLHLAGQLVDLAELVYCPASNCALLSNNRCAASATIISQRVDMRCQWLVVVGR